jgi:hypothetical protein
MTKDPDPDSDLDPAPMSGSESATILKPTFVKRLRMKHTYRCSILFSATGHKI